MILMFGLSERSDNLRKSYLWYSYAFLLTKWYPYCVDEHHKHQAIFHSTVEREQFFQSRDEHCYSWEKLEESSRVIVIRIVWKEECQMIGVYEWQMRFKPPPYINLRFMPRTVSSEYSLLNSFSHQAERSLARCRRISKRRPRNFMRNSKLTRPRRKTQRGKITVYSPEYAIRISEVSTPLYHSDEHTPAVSGPQPSQTSFRSYIDEAVLRKVYKEEYEQMELVLRMRGCRIRGEESSC